MWQNNLLRGNTPTLLLSQEKFLSCNQAAAKFFALNSPQDCLSLHPSKLSPEYQPDGQTSYQKSQMMIALCLAQGAHQFFWIHMTSDNTLRPVIVVLTDISNEQTDLLLAQLFSIDNNNSLISSLAQEFSQVKETSQQQDYELLNQHKNALDKSAIVSKTDPYGRITYVNDYFCELAGYKREELLGKTHRIINHPEMPRKVFTQMWQQITRGETWQGVIQNRAKNNKSYYVASTITPIFNDVGQIIEFISIRHDITELYEKENVILAQNIDPETKLNNKSKLLEQLESGQYKHLAIAEIKELSDLQHVYSHQQYIELLEKIVDYFKQQLSSDVAIFRNSDIQFSFISTAKITNEDLVSWCNKLIDLFGKTKFFINDVAIFLSAQIGLADIDKGRSSYTNASLALNYAKNNDLTICLFQENSNLQQQLENTLDWTQKLAHGINSQHFFIFGQPLVSQQGEVYSTEILMRYQQAPDSEFISPFFFLDFARKANLYTSISQMIIEQAFEFCFQSQRRISINLEPTDFTNAQTCQLVLSLLEKTGCGQLITFEIVESEILDIQNQQILDFITQVKQHGCLIAIDDFGTGYSNLNYLTSLPIDILKIDGSLIRDITDNEKHLLIVKAIIKFAHALNVKVVAEFVANEAIYHLLQNIGVDYYQGYYFDAPSLLKLAAKPNKLD